MQDTEFEKAGSQVSEKDKIAQIDAVLNEPKRIPNEVTDLNGETHPLIIETFSTYKTKEVLKMLAAARNDIDIVALISGIQLIATPIPTVKYNADGTVGEWTDAEKEELDARAAQRANAIIQILPTIAQYVPDLLLEFGALALIPNRDLAVAHKNGVIAELREEKREWLDFNFDASVVLRLLALYLPHIGINLIMQELGKLDGTTTSLLQNASRPSTG